MCTVTYLLLETSVVKVNFSGAHLARTFSGTGAAGSRSCTFYQLSIERVQRISGYHRSRHDAHTYSTAELDSRQTR